MYSDEDSLNKLRRGLYSRQGIRRQRSSRPESKPTDSNEKPSDWEYEEISEEEPEKPEEKVERKTNKKVNIFFIASALIFVLALGFVIYRFFFATDIMSPRKVLIEIDGPTTARAGSEVFFDVSIENTNKSDLLDTRLTIVFPENSFSANGDGEKVDRLVEDLGVISAEETVSQRFGVSLFGGEGEDVEIDLLLEYGTEHSSGRLSNELVHTVHISSSPVSLLIAPNVRSVQSGNEFEIEVDVSSNTQSTVEDVLVRANYPGGFTFVSSNPSPVSSDNVWNLGSLRAREIESITIRGYLEGQDSENKYFAFEVGSSRGNNEISNLYASAREPVRITLPPIAISTSINRNSGHTVSIPPGQSVNLEIKWRNLLSTPVNNLVIEAEIDDDYIDADSIRTNNGFYQSARQSVVWNQSTISSLQSVSARSEGSVSVSFRVMSGNDLRGVVNPEIPIKVRAYASEPQGVGASREVENEVARTVRIASQLGLSQRLSHSAGPFSNTGPLPPEVDRETTYTVTWSITNAGNAAENTSVRAALPAYVEFVGSGNDSSVRYSPLTNEVVWNVGDVRENAGISGGGVAASFQISVTPSRSQGGSAPILIRDAVVEGRDSFTGSRLQGYAPALTTQSLNESGAGVVVR